MEFEPDVATRSQEIVVPGHGQVSPSRSSTAPRKGTARHRKRPEVRGKAIYIDDQPFFVKGVSYGAFRPDAEKREYQDLGQIEQDFALMAAHGINTVRIPHTMPPEHLLDAAQRHGLYVMVGLSAEQYVGYLIDTHRKDRPDVGHRFVLS